MNTRKIITLATTGLLALAIAAPAFAAAYMKYEGVDGRITAAPTATTARAKGGWIEIESWSFGAAGTRTCTGESGPGDIKAGPVRGAPAHPAGVQPKMSFQVEQPDGSLLTYELENVLITSAQAQQAEELNLHYNKIKWSYSKCPPASALLLPAIQKVRKSARRMPTK